MLIQLYPSNNLLQKSVDVEVFDNELVEMVKEMSTLMRRLKGAGLAAPQVGVNKNLFIMELGKGDDTDPLTNLQVVINPKIISLSEQTSKQLEGCLSFPSVFENISRSVSVDVNCQDLEGNSREYTFIDMSARCFQHEYEHLQGEVFIKHVSALKRDMAKRKMSKINSMLGRRV